MSKIEVKNSSIVINNYNLGDCPKLEYTFSIYNRIYHTSFLKAVEYIEEKKQLIIPRGVDKYWIENMFFEKAEYINRSDPFDCIGNVGIKYLPRDEKQKEALRFMIGVGEYSYNKNKPQLAINLNTGVGKTYCAIAAAAYNQRRSIVIAYSINWIEQWKNFILEYTDTKPKEIYIISGSSSIDRLLKKDISKYKFILATHGTLKSYGDTNGWDSITDLFRYIRVGLKIYDECHLNFDNMCKIDYYTNTVQTMYVSATPARSDEDENVIFGYYFKNVPSIELFDEENDPHTQYIALRYNSHPSPEQISNCNTKQYGLNRNLYTNYVVETDNFYKILLIVLDWALKLDGKALIYIGTIHAIDVVYAWIYNNFPFLINDVGIYNSSVDVNKNLQLEKKIILSTTKSCGAAMDIKGLKMTVVLAEPFKSEVLARQSLGRTRDDDTVYIEVVDNGFAHIKKYYYYKKPIFDKYATKCTEVTLSDDELDIKSTSIMNKMMEIQMQHDQIPIRIFDYIPDKPIRIFSYAV